MYRAPVWLLASKECGLVKNGKCDSLLIHTAASKGQPDFPWWRSQTLWFMKRKWCGLCIMRIPTLFAGICLREQGRGRERVGLFKEQNWKLTLDKMVKYFEIRIYCGALCFRKCIHPTTSEMIYKHLKDGNFSKLIIPQPTAQSHAK